MKRKKSSSQKAHFKQRFMERYGVVCFNPLYLDLLRQIRNHESELIECQSRRLQIHKVQYPGGEAYVVFDCVRNSLVTALTEEQCQGRYWIVWRGFNFASPISEYHINEEQWENGLGENETDYAEWQRDFLRSLDANEGVFKSTLPSVAIQKAIEYWEDL